MCTPPKKSPLLFLISTAAIFTFAASYLAGLIVEKGPCFQVSDMLELKSKMAHFYDPFYTISLWITTVTALLSARLPKFRSLTLLSIGSSLGLTVLPVTHSILSKPQFKEFGGYLLESLTVIFLILLTISLELKKQASPEN
jgi:hypothetical protein